MPESFRLLKRVVDIMACSRSEAEAYICGGWVSVDGQIVELPGHRVQSEQVVAVSPDATLEEQLPVTILLHKPAGSVIDASDGSLSALINLQTQVENERSGVRFLQRHLTGLHSALPLAAEESGLLVLTQDWRVKRKLIDDAATVECEYVVEVQGQLVDDGLKILNAGFHFNGRNLTPAKVSWQNETRLRFAIKNAQPRQIAHMCSTVGLQACSIKRIRIGRLPMAKLPVGEWRYLLGYERF